ncbi:MAG: histidine phosphatase family protein, partial [Ktedonobacteraceae bacterium]|nr:histidine phosphatase family protein [Ktedonobacteraceae bacterium]
MSQLILVRHSVPEIVPGLPARSWSLAPEGRERGQALAEKLRVAGHQPSVVVSSTEPKAEQTASIIASAYGMPYEVVEGLHEHERDGVPFMERALFEKVVADFFERPTE